MNSAKIALAAFAAGVAVMGAVYWIRTPRNLEECFVSEARGLSDKAASIAYQMCEIRFPKPVLTEAEVFGN